MKNIFSRYIKWLAKAIMIVFFVLSFALLFISIFRPEWIKMAVEWIGNLVKYLGAWNYLIAFFSACIESFPVIGALVPGMNVMILVGGFWGATSTEALILTIICASFGAMLGNFFGFWIGTKYGKYIVTHYGHYIGVGKTEEKIMEKQITKNGFWYIVLGKFHGTLRSFIPFVAGSSRMTSKNFWLYNSIGSVIWAITINLIGVFFIQNYEIILDNINKILTLGIVALLLYLFFFKKEALKQYWHDKNQEFEDLQAQKSQKSQKNNTI